MTITARLTLIPRSWRWGLYYERTVLDRSIVLNVGPVARISLTVDR